MQKRKKEQDFLKKKFAMLKEPILNIHNCTII